MTHLFSNDELSRPPPLPSPATQLISTRKRCVRLTKASEETTLFIERPNRKQNGTLTEPGASSETDGQQTSQRKADLLVAREQGQVRSNDLDTHQGSKRRTGHDPHVVCL